MKLILFRIALSLLICPTLIAGPVRVFPSAKILAEKHRFTVTGEEPFAETEGFGRSAAQVRMMNLMMVEGSGYEGMEMHSGHGTASSADHAAPTSDAPAGDAASGPIFAVKTTPSPPRVGENTVEFTVRASPDGPPQKALKFRADISMVTMDMGTEIANVREVAPARYQFVANFSMAGAWQIKLSAGPLSRTLRFEVE